MDDQLAACVARVDQFGERAQTDPAAGEKLHGLDQLLERAGQARLKALCKGCTLGGFPGRNCGMRAATRSGSALRVGDLGESAITTLSGAHKLSRCYHTAGRSRNERNLLIFIRPITGRGVGTDVVLDPLDAARRVRDFAKAAQSMSKGHTRGDQRFGPKSPPRGVWILMLPALLLGGCSWVELAWNALTYPTTRSGESANVVVHGEWAYVTKGAAGIEAVYLGRRKPTRVVPVPGGGSVDDLAVADGLLFALDARPPGHLAVYTLENPSAPTLRNSPAPVEVGPFSGVSAGGGRVIVSGGTSRLSMRGYDRTGSLGSEIVTADFGRGQPDVVLATDGGAAYVSTHDWGPYFEITIARLASEALQITRQGALPLDTYGFTPGGAKPANFPIEGAADGSILYLAFAAGLGVLDVADPSMPKLLVLLKLDVKPVNVDVHDSVAALVGSSPSPRLVLVDVRDPSHPTILQSIPLPEDSLATGVAIASSHVVVAAHGRGTLLFNRTSNTWEKP